MNSFGLGLVLDFRDRASAGIQRVSQAFREMSGLADELSDTSSRATTSLESLAAAGYAMSTVGDSLTNTGSSILGTLKSVLSYSTQTGTTLLTARTQLEKLYGSAEAGEATLQRISEYAERSIFNFEDLIPSVIMLKANGIEAFDAIASSTGKANQNLLDYAADLAAFNPQMRNAYGTGIQAAIGAINEYISEGNDISLKRGASLDILQILGEEKGSTIEERSRQIADLLEKLNMVGTVANLAGTPMQRLSNAQDKLFRFMTMVSDAGLYDTYTELIATFTDYIESIPADEMQSLAAMVSSALTAILNPMIFLVKVGIKVVDVFRDIAKEHPGLAKVLTVMTALSGVALVLFGTLLKFAGSLFLLVTTIEGLSRLGSVGAILGMISSGLFKIFLLAVPLAGIAYVIYLAWSRNVGGIADLLQNKLVKAFQALSLVLDAFFDNTLSEERWNRAKELGILPFIETLLTLKYNVHQVMIAVSESIVTAMELIFERFPNWSGSLKQGISNMFQNALEAGKDLIERFGWDGIAGVIITGLMLAFKPSLLLVIFTPLISLMGTLGLRLGMAFVTSAVGGRVFSFLLYGVGALMVGLRNALMLALPLLMKLPILGTILKFFLAIPLRIMAGMAASIGLAPILIGAAIISAIAVIVALIMGNSDTIKNAFTTLWNKLPEPVQEVLIKVKNTISTFVQGLIDALGLQPVIDRVAQAMPMILQWFNYVGNRIMQIIGKVIDWVKTAWDGWLGDLVRGIGQFVVKIITIVGSIAGFLFPIILNIIDTVLDIVLPIVDVIGNVLSVILDIVNAAMDGIAGVIKGIIQVIQGIIDFLTGVFTGDWEKVWTGVKEIFSGIFEAIKSIFTGTINTITSGINSLSSKLNGKKIPFTDIVINIPQIPQLATGGFIKNEGLSYLHPNEVVVNSPMTKSLGSFLGDYESTKTDSTKGNPVLPDREENPDDSDTIVIDIPGGDDFPRYPTPKNPPAPVSSGGGNNDYSVTFAPGSVVIQGGNMSDAELEAAAEKLMKIIERKQKIKEMSNRRKKVVTV